MDAGPHAPLSVRISREIQRSNPRLAPIDALLLSARVVDAARANRLPPAFLAATLLQESGFAPDAMSPAGAVGIAQFMVSTALAHGVANPWDPDEAIDGAAALLAGYVRAYRGRRESAFDLAMAAYNAGPGAVSRYGGIPPYPETVQYIDDIKDRWSRIVGR
jgi:soluble lytic murein transglycosylase-like protein